MQTQENKRRTGARKSSDAVRRKATGGKASAAKSQTRHASVKSAPVRRMSTRGRTQTADERRRKISAARSRRNTSTRTVKPPREDIPQVVYTMPKPFRKGSFLLKLVSVAACVMAVMLCLSLFFRVDTITVSGTEKYTPWMIYEASGLEEGDSLLGVRKARVAGNIIASLPYVGQVKVGINLPGTVNIEIRELDMTYAIHAVDNTWWLIAADGRVIEQIETSAAAEYTRILGVQADAPRIGQPVSAAETVLQTQATESAGGVTIPTQIQITAAQRLQAALQIAQTLEQNGVIGQVSSVDVTDFSDMTFEYGQRIHVVLGDESNLVYKVTYAAQAIAKLEEYQTGELDVSMEFSDQALFTPEG